MRPGKLLLETLIATTLLVLPVLAPAAPNTLEEANRQAEQLVQRLMTEQRIPGLQVAVVKDGKLALSLTYGVANVENRLPANGGTLFPINSATKAFTGVAAMRLVEAGRLDLDAPISRYLSDLPATWQAVRVRQLLGHTSGLPDINGPQGLIGEGGEAAAWKAVKALPPEAAAGERYAYNQTNYGLLAQIIAKQAGMPYEQYMAEQVFAPAGMARSTFGDSYDVIANAATMYSYFPRGTLAKDDATRLSRWVYDIPYSLWAGGGVLSTAEEMARWVIAVTHGRLISAASLARMWTPEMLNNGKPGPWAAGWVVQQGSPPRHLAGMGGARAAFIVYPDDRLAVVFLTNLVGSNPQNFIPQIAALYTQRQGTTP